MRFWDSSAIVPLLVNEGGREPVLGLLERDSSMAVWWGTPIECASAISRREREGAIPAGGATLALARLRMLAKSWNEIVASEQVRATAQRLLRVHPLRAGDSLQLAAALVASDGSPGSLPFVCLDERLRIAAEKEGFATEPVKLVSLERGGKARTSGSAKGKIRIATDFDATPEDDT